MGDEVELTDKLKYRVERLVTLSREIEEDDDYEDLVELVGENGWQGFRGLDPSLWGDEYTWTYQGGRERDIKYFTRIIFPENDEAGRLLHPFSFSERYPLCAGDALIDTAWNNVFQEEISFSSIGNKKLSPRISHVYDVDRRSDDPYEKHTTITFCYIDRLFYPYLKNPVSLPALDSSARLPEIRYGGSRQAPIINTLESTQGRGLLIEKVIEELTRLFPGVRIAADPSVSRALVKMFIQTPILTDFLDAIGYCVGTIWEWVDRNEILLIPGENFGKFARIYNKE
ncbi:MAG: hypothetical protein SNF33_03700 [Candidatus Algichlamydia australiensis]|nr:hypothetical protein [Chlamydiales bacterium]